MARRIDSHALFNLSTKGKDVSFFFDGKVIWAKGGDTVTAGLIAAGQKLLSRSFKSVSYTHLTLPTKA